MCQASVPVAIVWLRNELRLHDQEALLAACSSPARYLVPLYSLNPGLLQPRSDFPELAGCPTLGPHKLRFLMQALLELQRQLAARGSGLHLALDSPHDAVTAVMHALAPRATRFDLYYYLGIGRRALAEERAVSDACRAFAAGSGVPCALHPCWGHTLFHPEDALAALAAAKGRKGRQDAAAQGSTAGGLPQHLNADPELFAPMPAVMTDFRKARMPCFVWAMEQHGRVRDPLPGPERFPPFPGSLLGRSRQRLPSEDVRSMYEAAGGEGCLDALAALTGTGAGQLLRGDAERTAFPLRGGELQGLQRLQHYLHGSMDGSETDRCQTEGPEPARDASTAENAQEAAAGEGGVVLQDNGSSGEAARPAQAPAQEHASCSGQDMIAGALTAPVHSFRDTRMGAVGVENSAKLSAYLAAGCLSARQVHALVVTAREQHGEDTGHSWLLMHLTIRDFFLFTALKDGPRLEGLSASCAAAPEPNQDAAAAGFQRWAAGRTGFPFVDACMRELAATGYMSNRGRQNVSSFLCKALGLDWRLGAAVFESLLVDHDWAVNFVNWAYFAGVGNDPRNRVFRTVSQGMTYDPDARLIRAWVPELAGLPAAHAHQPWAVPVSVAEQCGFDLARDYVEPMLDPASQIAVNYGSKEKPGKA